MLRNTQHLSQKQTLQQKLSPQQLQYIRLLQIPTQALEQVIKEELELNPLLEEVSPEETEIQEEFEEATSLTEDISPAEHSDGDEEAETLDQHEVDWEEFEENTEFDGEQYFANHSASEEEWRELPNPYRTSLLENLEEQVGLLNLNEQEQLIADQILGSIDQDGYFRRDPEAVVDNIAFNHGILVSTGEVERIRRAIQKLDPVGIASTDLRDCLLIQLLHSNANIKGRDLAIKMLRNEWEAFKKKHYDRLINRLNTDESELKHAFNAIRMMDPRPGVVADAMVDSQQIIQPDFEVFWEEDTTNSIDNGHFTIRLTHGNIHALRISPEYKQLWERSRNNPKSKETQVFIRDKMNAAQWFIESIKQRRSTLLKTMETIVSLQQDFFRYGESLRPMILRDVAERIGMDISTVSRVVNGKYVQTRFGVFELKYFLMKGWKRSPERKFPIGR